MRHCWICRTDILDGEESKDHVVPRKTVYGNTFGKQSYRWPKSIEWFWAHKLCNNARGNISLQVVEEIQKLLDQKLRDWGPEVIREALRIRNQKNYIYSNEVLTDQIAYFEKEARLNGMSLSIDFKGHMRKVKNSF